MDLIEAVKSLTEEYRAEVIYSTNADDYDADGLLDWAVECVSLESEDDDAEPREYVATTEAIYAISDDGYRESVAVVSVKTLCAWDPNRPGEQIGEDGWDNLDQWREWALEGQQ